MGVLYQQVTRFLLYYSKIFYSKGIIPYSKRTVISMVLHQSPSHSDFWLLQALYLICFDFQGRMVAPASPAEVECPPPPIFLSLLFLDLKTKVYPHKDRHTHPSHFTLFFRSWHLLHILLLISPLFGGFSNTNYQSS